MHEPGLCELLKGKQDEEEPQEGEESEEPEIDPEEQEEESEADPEEDPPQKPPKKKAKAAEGEDVEALKKKLQALYKKKKT